ncbi:isochorismatase family protein [Bradyrhizobium lablabi]|uniref:isochorismatase family protein n=1 Tax=Bradyrhizobium lablabi TaxID=722472 RepID=UPI001BA8DDD6|nr:isochorismatase family protein [Bradyrhizobium lablabi]MBR1122436.1 isochorismatase family protein [Bradyrhizobium lablabi]
MIAGGEATPPLHEEPPVLVCANLQIEVFAEAADADEVASRCGALLSLWRDNLWPVLHLKRIARAAWFDPQSNRSDWISGFRPRPGEMVFEHPLPSAYSATRFAEYMSSMKNIRCAVMGLSLDETILATVIEGFHRGHRYQVITDAVACGREDAGGYKAAVLKAAGNFAGVVLSSDLARGAVASVM